MTAYVSNSSGNWSTPTVWTPNGTPGNGDTVSIGHAIAVDSNRTIGNSPNNTTTNVVAITAGSLTINAGVTLTVRGNWTESSTFGNLVFMLAGSQIIFDNSASGGSPVYTLSSTFNGWSIAGTSGSRCGISAIAGQTAKVTFTQLYVSGPGGSVIGFTYCDFTRLTMADDWSFYTDFDVSITHCHWDQCGTVHLTSSTTTRNVTITDNIVTNGTDSSTQEDIYFDFLGIPTSGTRLVKRNLIDRRTHYKAYQFSVQYNFFGDYLPITPSVDFADVTYNLFRIASATGVGSGSSNNRFPDCDVNYNYFYSNLSAGNPQFMSSLATNRDCTVAHNIFEHEGGDGGTNSGGAIFPQFANSHVNRIQNNIVLPSSQAGNPYASCLLVWLTDDEAGRSIEVTHNTVFNRNSAGVGAIQVAYGGNGHANEVPILKSNLFWSNASGGLIASRKTGTVNAIITASGADYNALYNGGAGDNGRGYDDQAGNLDLWTGGAANGGNAAASHVDDHQLTSNPQLVDSTRNLAAWALARGYGSTSAEAITAIKADTTARIPDLINWVAQGNAPLNSDYWKSAHDGTTIGALQATYGQVPYLNRPENRNWPNPRGRRPATSLLSLQTGYNPSIYPPIAFPSVVVMAQGFYVPPIVMGYQLPAAQGLYNREVVSGYFPEEGT